MIADNETIIKRADSSVNHGRREFDAVVINDIIYDVFFFETTQSQLLCGTGAASVTGVKWNTLYNTRSYMILVLYDTSA